MHQGRRKGPTAWVRKAIEESRKGNGVVLVYPIDKWVLMLLQEIFTYNNAPEPRSRRLDRTLMRR